MTHTKLESLKHLLKTSKHFLKSNWKRVVYYFIPIQVGIFAIALIMDLLPAETDSRVIVISSLVLGILAFLGSIFLKMISAVGPLVLKSIEDGDNQKNVIWYKTSLKKIVPIAWIGILVSLLNISFITIIGLASIIIFIIPSIIVGILLKIGFVDFAFYFQDIFVNNVVVGTMLATLSVVAAVSSIAFFINSYFSIYVFLLEGRLGFDAIATSFLSVAKRRTKIILRVIGIWVIALSPFIILVFPIQAKILYDALRSMAIEVFLLQIPPAWPDVPAHILVIKDSLYFVASVLSLPIFVTLNYFLWKNVHATTHSFEEGKYNKTRKWIKIGVWAGLVILVGVLALSILSALSFGK